MITDVPLGTSTTPATVIGAGLTTLIVIGGALVITGADLAARTMVGDADLPLGMFTALIGGPVFFILLRRSRRAGAGW